MAATDEAWFAALEKVLTNYVLWRVPPSVNIQLHVDDYARLRQAKFNGRVRNNGGFMTINRKANDWNEFVTVWPGTTVKKNWVGIEIDAQKVKQVNLFPRAPRVKKPKPERLSRFDRDFEV